jgi:hypothetical protein
MTSTWSGDVVAEELGNVRLERAHQIARAGRKTGGSVNLFPGAVFVRWIGGMPLTVLLLSL